MKKYINLFKKYRLIMLISFLILVLFLYFKINYHKYPQSCGEIPISIENIFSFNSEITIEDILNDKKANKLLFSNVETYDKNFKIALFYSEFSLQVLEMSKQNKCLTKYNCLLYDKTIEKWNKLIKKDRETYYFKANYMEKYYKLYISLRKTN